MTSIWCRLASNWPSIPPSSPSSRPLVRVKSGFSFFGPASAAARHFLSLYISRFPVFFTRCPYSVNFPIRGQTEELLVPDSPLWDPSCFFTFSRLASSLTVIVFLFSFSFPLKIPVTSWMTSSPSFSSFQVISPRLRNPPLLFSVPEELDTRENWLDSPNYLSLILEVPEPAA